LEEAKATLMKPVNADAIHGGLLAMQSLLNHTGMVGSFKITVEDHGVGWVGADISIRKQFMKDHYKISCELILKYKDHKEPLIRRSVVTLLPAMGTYDTQAFIELFLARSMAHLLQQLQRPNERDAGESKISFLFSFGVGASTL
jgi:FKBP12-rapamycin complex-associated protein